MLIYFKRLKKLLGINITRIHDDVDDVEKVKTQRCFKNNFKFEPCYIYSLLIFFLLLINPLIILYLIIITHDYSMISTLLFKLLPPINYILLFKYFYYDYFDKVYLDLLINKREDYITYIILFKINLN